MPRRRRRSLLPGSRGILWDGSGSGAGPGRVFSPLRGGAGAGAIFPSAAAAVGGGGERGTGVWSRVRSREGTRAGRAFRRLLGHPYGRAPLSAGRPIGPRQPLPFPLGLRRPSAPGGTRTFPPPSPSPAPESGRPAGPRSPGLRLPPGPRPGGRPWGEAAPRRMRAGLPRLRPAPPPGRACPAETLPPQPPSPSSPHTPRPPPAAPALRRAAPLRAGARVRRAAERGCRRRRACSAFCVGPAAEPEEGDAGLLLRQRRCQPGGRPAKFGRASSGTTGAAAVRRTGHRTAAR